MSRRKGNRPTPRVKRYSPGQAAREIFNSGDVDRDQNPIERVMELRHSRDENISHLEEQAKKRLHDVEVRTQGPIAVLNERLERLRDRETVEEERYAERVVTRAEEKTVMDRWRRLGLKDRIFLITLPGWMHGFLLTVLAGIDFYVFARAFAIAENVDASLTNPEFWFGGLIGIALFVAGWLLGRSLKKLNMTVAKAAIARRLATSDPDVETPEVGAAHLGAVAMSGLMFFGFLYFGLRVRLEAEVESLATVGLQILIPILVVFVEYALHDPTEVAPTRRRFTHWRIRRRRSAVQAELASAVTERDMRLSAIRDEHTQATESTAIWWAREESQLRTLLEGISKQLPNIPHLQNTPGRSE